MENKMNRDERMIKSARARNKRKVVKTIRNTLTKRYYAHMKHLRQKYQKIRARQHDSEE